MTTLDPLTAALADLWPVLLACGSAAVFALVTLAQDEL